ncbi:hypothetical protein [Leptospira neocaledonica]|uniref:Uncharacterized protein n=1 Tax=Leptospira neocaledonica TaxID=2023192 RepID=A0A2M9ZT60_9LEPT|nr:hypothetical protein [Leptospira neocaledonica]PJZ75270.1 hypothetical protein CH365_19740 [Leptospira neocaledonica]
MKVFNKIIIIDILFFVCIFGLNSKEEPSEDNYLSKYSSVRKDVTGGVQTTRYRDGEFYERTIFYFKTNAESEKLPPEVRPSEIPITAQFNLIFRKWEDVSILNGKRALYYGSGLTAGKTVWFISIIGADGYWKHIRCSMVLSMVIF